MKLKYPNQQEIPFLKAFTSKINNKEYLFYVTASNGGNDTVVFGELQGTNFVPVNQADAEIVKGFLVDVNNSTALNNPNYTITIPNLDTVIVTGGSSTILITASVDLLTNLNQQEEVVSFDEPAVQEPKVEEPTPLAPGLATQEVVNNAEVVTAQETTVPEVPSAPVEEVSATPEVPTQEVVNTQEVPSTPELDSKPKKKKGKGLKIVLIILLLAVIAAGIVWLVMNLKKDKKPKVVEETTIERKSLECIASPNVEIEKQPFTVSTDFSLQFDPENNLDVLVERERHFFESVDEFNKYKAATPEEKPDSTLGVDVDYFWSKDSKVAIKTTVYMKNHTKEDIWNEKTKGMTTVESAKTLLTEKGYNC